MTPASPMLVELSSDSQLKKYGDRMSHATNRHGLVLEHGTNHIDPRRRLNRLRIALHAVITHPGGQDTPEPEAEWHDLTRAEPRAAHPCEKERRMIANAIRQGCTTPDKVLSYFLARITDAMAEFQPPVEVSTVCYLRLMQEQAEAIEAQTLARGLGTDEARDRAIRETQDIIPLAQLYVAGGARHPVPMGVR